MRRHRQIVLALLLLPGCSGSRDPANRSGVDDGTPLIVFAAGSLARPLRAALDSFKLDQGVNFSLELSGSLDLARRVTELGQVPDVIALADEEVFPQLLMPRYVSWYARFARNRMVLARRPTLSAATIAGDAWWRRATAPGVEVGRSDPDVDPAGYRALLLFQLAERHYAQPRLADRLLASASQRNVRPKSAELVALLQAGELDYGYMYESSARGARLPFDTLPSAIDLGSQADSAIYARASVRVLGARPGDSLTAQGAPIHYALSVPGNAHRPAEGAAFVRYLFSPVGQRVLRAEYLDVLAAPRVVGDSIPSGIRPLLGRAGS
ncbi:MAG: extracellular solute-binding protein [Gemmatimonadaceae bacterium]